MAPSQIEPTIKRQQSGNFIMEFVLSAAQVICSCYYKTFQELHNRAHILSIQEFKWLFQLMINS